MVVSRRWPPVVVIPVVVAKVPACKKVLSVCDPRRLTVSGGAGSTRISSALRCWRTTPAFTVVANVSASDRLDVAMSVIQRPR